MGSAQQDMAMEAADGPALHEMIDEAESMVDGSEAAVAFDVSQDPTLLTLREISSLASWTVSSHKPGCGTEALLAPTAHSFWQSDGPQPHFLTLHFFKTVRIARLRIYLDFQLDESYTPTRIEFWAGWSSSYGLVQFGEWAGGEPRGWQEISLDGVGVKGKPELRCMVLQVRIIENHQNGKDTHLRGLQVFTRLEGSKVNDVNVRHEASGKLEDKSSASPLVPNIPQDHYVDRSNGLMEPSWLREPELR